MRDLGVLKEQIEYAERHLKAAHSARERESDALMAMWSQIRDRFDAQEQEIARYRSEVENLTQVNEELSALVDRLISTVEGSVDQSENETVPEVSRLAGELLSSEPEIGAFAHVETSATETPSTEAYAAPDISASLDELETDDPLELGTPIDEPLELDTPIDEAADDGGSSFGDMLNEAMEAEDGVPAPKPVQSELASVGIRDLIARIEDFVGKNSAAEKDEEGEEDELSRELREIESLRSQLTGLHDRISKTG